MLLLLLILNACINNNNNNSSFIGFNDIIQKYKEIHIVLPNRYKKKANAYTQK
jgi:hypothetical protein